PTAWFVLRVEERVVSEELLHRRRIANARIRTRHRNAGRVHEGFAARHARKERVEVIRERGAADDHVNAVSRRSRVDMKCATGSERLLVVLGGLRIKEPAGEGTDRRRITWSPQI